MWDLFWKSSSSTINSQLPWLVMLEMVFKPSQYSVEIFMLCSIQNCHKFFYLSLFLQSPPRNHSRVLMRNSLGGCHIDLVFGLLSILHINKQRMFDKTLNYFLPSQPAGSVWIILPVDVEVFRLCKISSRAFWCWSCLLKRQMRMTRQTNNRTKVSVRQPQTSHLPLPGMHVQITIKW